MTNDLLRRAAQAVRDHGNPDIVRDYHAYKNLLTNPAVFEALAGWLDATADVTWYDSKGEVVREQMALAVARAILREDGNRG